VPTSPDGVTDVYTLTAAPATTRMLPGKDTPVWAINGVVPAPTIRARAGRPVQVNLTNNLPETTNIHNHGMFTRPEFDGLPMQQIATGGGTYTYRYPNAQSARTLWYHDHVMDKTGPHVYKGLAGFYLVSDPNEDSLGLPSGADEVPLLIQDKIFNSDGSLSYPLSASTITSGVLGKVIVVNGVQQPFFPVAPHKLRLRLLNGSDARQYTLALSNGQPLIQIGSEGGLLPAPVSKSSIVLGPAERADVLVDLSGLGGTSVVLNNTAGSGGVGAVMRFDVQTATPVTSTTPSTLAPFTPIPPSDATVTRTFTLSQSSGVWVINGKAFDPNRVDVPVAFGATEIWSFTNNSSQRHLLHLHDVTFQILDINGSPPPTGKRANTEMVNIPPVGRARIIVRFGNDHGTYVFHCHVLAHEDHAMMAQFNVS
jgi:spore coat protein A